MTTMEHAERVIRNYLCLRQLPLKVIESIKKRIAFEIGAYNALHQKDDKRGKKSDVVLIDYKVFTALRKIATDQYEAGNCIPPSRLAYVLDTEMDKLPEVIDVVKATYRVLFDDKERLI